MKWRFIPYQEYDPYVKNGLNSVALSHANQHREGVIWLSGWAEDTVNIGYGQSIEDALDVEVVEQENICIVRRQGGGGAVFLGEKGEVSLSIAGPESSFPNTKQDIYRKITRVLIRVLEQLQIPCAYEPVNDVVTRKGKKISGGTLKHKGKTLYVGATLIYKLDKDKMFSVLTPNKDKYLDKGYKDVADRVTSIQSENEDIELSDVIREMTKEVTNTFNTRKSSWTKEEHKKAEEKAKKYMREEWIYRR